MHRDHVLRFIRKRPGLLILCAILIAITFSIIKPDFYLMGWDNFSSYLNAKSDIFNTIFATWRQHRGLGVPSDAEVNDIFRQLFSFVLSFFVGTKLVDQIYMACMLWGGVLGMYTLGRYVSRRLKQNPQSGELFGFIAGFFYLFNLSTLAVFYFPMIMYNTRFFMLPTTVLVLLHLIDKPHLTPRSYISYIIILLAGMGSFMVPTIYIVLSIAFLLMGVIFRKTQRLLAVFVFYIMLGMFWMLPFANYTVQKSSVVPKAPTFVEINESMLNKPKSYYSFGRQAKLRPSFFESQFHNNNIGFLQSFHELSGQDEKGWRNIALWIFPAMYLLGILYIFLFKRVRILVWFASTTLVFLILSMKEYSPLGFIYSFISDHIPFANTIFRFGDTKFHAMVAFGGSVAAAFFIVQAASKIDHSVKKHALRLILFACAGAVIILHLSLFRSYFNGNTIGFFMYNIIPPAYFEIADIINKDPEPVRAIQLPFDSHTYWKPYSWGYFGSAFLHFMINKPLFDRTFEPASMESADIHKQIMDILNMSSSVPDETMLNERSLTLYKLLGSLSVKYIIDDQTISTNIDARNLQYWGTIKPLQSHRLMTYLEQAGYLRRVKKFDVNATDYSKYYATIYPYNKKFNYTYEPRSIYLYELTGYRPQMELVNSAEKVHTMPDQFVPAGISTKLNNFIQSPRYDNESMIHPFAYAQGIRGSIDGALQVSLPVTLGKGEYQTESNYPAYPVSRLMNVYVQNNEASTIVSFENSLFPVLDKASPGESNNAFSFEIPSVRSDAAYIRVEDSLLPVEGNTASGIQFVGPVMVHDDTFMVSLLYPQNTFDVSGNIRQLEPDPQCMKDAVGNAKSSVNTAKGVLEFEGENVSTCLTTEIPLPSRENTDMQLTYSLLEFEAEGTGYNVPQHKYIDSAKPNLGAYMGKAQAPLTMYVCIKSVETDECLNNEAYYRLSENMDTFAVPVSGNISDLEKLRVTFAVKGAPRQTYKASAQNIRFKTFASREPALYTAAMPEEFAQSFTLDHETEINFKIPLAASAFSQQIDLKKDSLLMRTDDSCRERGNDQRTGDAAAGILSYVVDCRNFTQKNIPFSSSNYYAWSIDYGHFSGSLPSFLLMDKFNTYYYEKLTPSTVTANDYFNVPLQRPESVFTTEKSVTDAINGGISYKVNGYINPLPDLGDFTNKELIIQHHSQNEGLINLHSISLTELPNYWQNIAIKPRGYVHLTFPADGASVEYRRLLPSLWEVRTDTVAGEYLFLFNEHFDLQWIPVGINTTYHARCNNYVNCYGLTLPEGRSHFYFLYVPELLSAMGWAITILTAIAGTHYLNVGRKVRNI